MRTSCPSCTTIRMPPVRRWTGYGNSSAIIRRCTVEHIRLWAMKTWKTKIDLVWSDDHPVSYPDAFIDDERNMLYKQLIRVIEEKKPKIISGEIYWDTYWEQRGQRIPAHIPDKNIIKKYYYPSNIANLYVLKPEYQKHKCVKDGRQWRYID